MERDAIDDLIDQWRAQRVDLDEAHLQSAGIVNRIGRLYGRAMVQLERALADHGLKLGEFDVLSALRREGAPYELTPAELVRNLFLSSGAMSNRIDRLEDLGYVERRPDLRDGRSVIVHLTPAGRRVVDRAIETHLAVEHALLAGLGERDRRHLDRIARRLLATPSPS